MLAFLRQFHAGVTLALHHGEEGAYGCLRRCSSAAAEIVFRIHAQIVLETVAHEAWQRAQGLAVNEGTSHFTVSQFAGRLVLNFKEGRVVAFSCALPPRNSNVSISAYDEIDMVFVPRMELVMDASEDVEAIRWTDALTETAARRALALKFYTSAEIHWLPLADALKRAEAIHRPIHAILVWGQLDDESC